MQRAVTCFVLTQAHMAPAKSWEDVLDSRKNCQEKCFGIASVITFACSHIDGPDSGLTSIKGYVYILQWQYMPLHGDENIRLSSLKTPWISQDPVQGDIIARKTSAQPRIYCLSLWDNDDVVEHQQKALRGFLLEAFCWSSEGPKHANLEQAKFLVFANEACRNFADVLKDHEEHQATSLQLASYIEYTCSPESRLLLVLDVKVMATLLQQVQWLKSQVTQVASLTQVASCDSSLEWLKSQVQMQQMITAKQETHHRDVQYISPVPPAGCWGRARESKFWVFTWTM